jgi:hypothetical protein
MRLRQHGQWRHTLHCSLGMMLSSPTTGSGLQLVRGLRQHCDMLATAICLERYMKHDLTTSSRDLIEKDWLMRWTERLGNPNRTPHQIMRTYVEDLDITIAHLNDEMDWDWWDFDAFEDVDVVDA